jgi:hypothetical protein
MGSKRPSSIQIMGQEVAIEYEDNLGEDENGDEIDGLFYEYDKLIKIRKSRDWFHHLLHELIHAILAYSGKSKNMVEGEEEEWTTLLETHFRDILKLNPRSKNVRWGD